MRSEERAEVTTSGAGPNASLSIGEFARRSRLSQKALRLYDRLGVLTPAAVDPANGYRRYRESQLVTARLVAMLRRIDMPLARVAAVVAATNVATVEVTSIQAHKTPSASDIVVVASPEAAALVAAYWAEVEDRIASQRELAAHLRIRLLGENGSYEMYQIQERDVPEQLVLTEQRHLLAHELPNWIPEAGMRLVAAAEGHGGMVGPMIVIYHGEVNQESDGPVEICVPIDPAKPAPTDVSARREPAHREAYTRITKAQVAFPQILSAYDAVGQWIGAHGKRTGAAPREVYFADMSAAGPNDEVCDIAFPVE